MSNPLSVELSDPAYNQPVRAADFDYDLPPDSIAQVPAKQRDQSRLLVLQRADNSFAHRTFAEVSDYLQAGDVLVVNNSKVFPARLRGINCKSGGEFELLLLEQNAPNDWWVMLRPAKRARVNTRIDFKNQRGETTEIHAIVTDANNEGHRRLQFFGTPNITDDLDQIGEVPLPPYIKRSDTSKRAGDIERYQTIYAEASGSIAAPTAGMHFTSSLLGQIRQAGVTVCQVTLHIGVGTFAPIKVEDISQHVMHEERFSVSEETAAIVNAAKCEGRRVVAVGTTSLRVLETIATDHNRISAETGRTRLFVHPPFHFRIVDALITNFHLPRSSLLMLVSAFASPGDTRGRAIILNAYAEAMRQRYRFFSYGDATLIL